MAQPWENPGPIVRLGLKDRGGLQLPGMPTILIQLVPASLSSVLDSTDAQRPEQELMMQGFCSVHLVPGKDQRYP